MSVHNHTPIPSLDGIRAVSIMIVFIAHARLSSVIPGGFGVTVFFFLSGFLITTLFCREIDRTGEIDLRAFYLRRLLRLSPPLFFTLAVVYSCVGLGILKGTADLGSIVSQALYYYNYYSIFYPDSTQGAHGLNVLWSLSVEEHFYLVFPFLFIALSRKIISIRHILFISFLILFWRFVRFYCLGADDYVIYASTDTRIDSILYGAILAILVWEKKQERLFPDRCFARLGILVGSFLVILFSFVFRDEVFRSTLRYSIQSIALMPIFYYAVFYPEFWVFRFLNWRSIRIIGLYSYTVYLIHTVVLGNLRLSAMAHFGDFVLAIVSFVICLFYASFVYYFVERPVKVFRSRLVYRRFGQA